MPRKQPDQQPTAEAIQATLAVMSIEMWPIDRLKPYAKNARRWSQEAVEKIAASIREFGWRQPIVADLKDEIVIGHMRWNGAKHLGLTEVPVHVARDLTPAQIKVLRIADNRLHEEAEWDQELLGRELLDLKVENVNIDLTGFEYDEIIESVFGGATAKSKKAKKKGNTGTSAEGKTEILVVCETEEQQAQLLERLTEEGFKCRALNS